MNGFILDTATHGQWTILFEMSALVALLPVVFFSLWGSAELQPWAIPTIRHSARDDVKNISGDVDVQFTVLPKDLPQSSSNKHLRIQIE
ncbi:unnamed protein product [Anisakis simplex]|uniref:Uncharacterized protein n=1 Tax=Anisakis simplex TaxID=6269 RepID=A0A3P6N1R0_ANISI|nr:unnamed protein product [Anisakis simplex]